MKKTITSILASIVVCILVSSCQTNYSILKRRYNSGYYIAHKKDISAGSFRSSDHIEQADNSIPTESLLPVENSVLNSHTITSSDKQESLKHTIKTVQRGANKLIIAPLRNIHKPVLESGSAVLLPFKTSASRYKMDHEEREGLSLFWLIILIVLILWALGLLAGGLGLGGFINILLIIALILLILWLLRVV
jgi:hypothetical protein